MSYTIRRLHKELGKLIDAGHGRKRVFVKKDSFIDNREADGCVILPVEGLGIRWVHNTDDDGGFKLNNDGTESGNHILVLAGAAGANAEGDLCWAETSE